MEITFNELKEKEVVNVTDGKKLGRVEDVVFEKDEGRVLGVIIPGEKKLFKRSDDIFVPIEELRRIGEDVILVKLVIKEEDYIPKSKADLLHKRVKIKVEKEN